MKEEENTAAMEEETVTNKRLREEEKTPTNRETTKKIKSKGRSPHPKKEMDGYHFRTQYEDSDTYDAEDYATGGEDNDIQEDSVSHADPGVILSTFLSPHPSKAYFPFLYPQHHS